MKKYYSFEDALEFLNVNQKIKYRMSDLQDMIARQMIRPCFYYKGIIAKACFTGEKNGAVYIGEQFLLNGYLDLGARVLEDRKLVQPPFFVKEAIQIASLLNPTEPPKYNRGEVDKNGYPIFFIVQTEALLDAPATKNIFLYESALFGINLPLEKIFISIDELEKIVQPQQLEKQNLTPAEPITTLKLTRQPPAEPVNTQPDTLLSTILDPSHPDHAPDLAIAVKLWLELYGQEEKTKHSHSHGADLFLEKQQLQTTAKQRVKEITSPIKHWNKQRRKAFDEAQK